MYYRTAKESDRRAKNDKVEEDRRAKADRQKEEDRPQPGAPFARVQHIAPVHLNKCVNLPTTELQG